MLEREDEIDEAPSFASRRLRRADDSRLRAAG